MSTSENEFLIFEKQMNYGLLRRVLLHHKKTHQTVPFDNLL